MSATICQLLDRLRAYQREQDKRTKRSASRSAAGELPLPIGLREASSEKPAVDLGALHESDGAGWTIPNGNSSPANLEKNAILLPSSNPLAQQITRPCVGRGLTQILFQQLEGDPGVVIPACNANPMRRMLWLMSFNADLQCAPSFAPLQTNRGFWLEEMQNFGPITDETHGVLVQYAWNFVSPSFGPVLWVMEEVYVNSTATIQGVVK